MNCPYPNCNTSELKNSDIYCPECQKPLKRCPACATANRSFAVYCRNCAGRLPESKYNWPMAKGGPQGLGINRHNKPGKVADMSIRDIKTIRLPDWCRCILVYDDHLFAFSQGGQVDITDISRSTAVHVLSFNLGSNIISMPAVHQGSLYVGVERHIYAYSLGALIAGQPNAEPRWGLQTTGTPIKSLVPVGNELYYTLMNLEKRHEIHVIQNIQGAYVNSSVKITAGDHLSSIAGVSTAKTHKIYFLSAANRNENHLHVINHSRGKKPDTKVVPIRSAPSRFRKRIPIAVIGAQVYLVFQKDNSLCRIDGNTGQIDRIFCKHVKDFVLEGLNEPIVTTSQGAFIRKTNREITLSSGESIRSWPLILKDRAVVLGMKDGSLHLYDIHNPGLPRIWEVSEKPSDFITAMAAYKNVIAAGNSKGVVKVGVMT